MAEKGRRGLPANFKIEAEDLPVQIGDYLEEEDTIRAQTLEATKKRVGEEKADRSAFSQGLPPKLVAASERLADNSPTPEPTAKPVPMVAPPKPVNREASSIAIQPEKGKGLHPSWKRPRRKQMNVSAEAERKLLELVEYFKEFGPQEDIRASEIFEALVLMAYDCKEQLNISSLPRRGAWGSQTEKNFPVLISHAFAQALVDHLRTLPKVSGI